MLIIILILSSIFSNSLKFIDINKNKIQLKTYEINELSYVSLGEISKKLNLKINYNRVLHKLSFSYKRNIVLLSPITNTVIVNSNAYEYKKPLMFVNGKFYLCSSFLVEKLSPIFDLVLFRNIVFIDPGHGGTDNGALSYLNKKKILEKDIVLNFSLLLKDKLIKKGFEVELSRTKDKNIELKKRIESANSINALSFISVHANFSKTNSEASGFEVYYLSEKASDTHAHIVAIAENNVFDKETISKDAGVGEILKSMFLSAHINESTKLAYSISTRLEKLSNRGVKKAPFYVLAGTSMPSVLIELGFMSNTSDLKNLLDKNWLNKVTESVAKGIALYVDSLIRSKEDEV